MKSRRATISRVWRPSLWGLLAVLAALAILTIHIGTKPYGMSPSEITTLSTSVSLKHHILHNPVYLPYLAIEHFVNFIFHGSITAYRLVSVAFGFATVLVLFFLIKYWEGRRTAIIGSVMFLTSSFFLHITRQVDPEILQLGLLSLITLGVAIKHRPKRSLLVGLGVLFVAASIYVPGLIWFVIAGAIWQRNLLRRELYNQRSWLKIILAVLFVVILIPFGWSVVNHDSIVLSFLGFPSHIISARRMLDNLMSVPGNIFIRGTIGPSLGLGQLPILNIFEDAMFILGLYSLIESGKLDRYVWLAGAAIIAIILITIGGADTVIFLLPIVYIIIAKGVKYIYQQWLIVFPKNPVAIKFGSIMVILAVIVSCGYQLENYYVAWQQAPQTQSIFSHSPKNI